MPKLDGRVSLRIMVLTSIPNLFLSFCALVAGSSPAADELPIDRTVLEGRAEIAAYGVRNSFTLDQIWSSIGSGEEGLAVDLTSIETLLDGTRIDPRRIYGNAYVGPYPFEAEESNYAYKRFRIQAKVREGKAELRLGYLLRPRSNSEGWVDQGRVCVRFELFLAEKGVDRRLGLYDTYVEFRVDAGRFEKLPSLVAGPFLGHVTSDDPTEVVLAFGSDEPTRPTIELDDGRSFSPLEERLHHEIRIPDLEPGRAYRYRIQLTPESQGHWHRLSTAPLPGKGPVRFAYLGDSREGVGEGMTSYMGLNYTTLERLSAFAYAQGAEFMIIGGDLVNGYTAQTEDLRAQFHAWRQAICGFWNERPVYPCMGNHDALLRAYQGVIVDRWPYKTESAEAVFAEMFLNPKNGPEPSNPLRPTYEENVYSFRFGLVKVIAFNNNYWYANPSHVIGGCPEGYLLPDQLEWIKREIAEADDDPSIHYTILFGQEPVFPCGGHAKDAMWHRGSNNVRAYEMRPDSSGVRRLHPAEKGLIEVRNELVRAVAASPKVALVLGADEHAYHRVLIGPEVPIGDPSRDDLNADGRIDLESEPVSPLADLRYNTWFVVSGGAGAPYYSEESVPWVEHWRAPSIEADSTATKFRYSSQENVVLFDADERRIRMDVYNPSGERIDGIENLMEAKGNR